MAATTYLLSAEAKTKWMGLDCKWNQWGSADLQLYSQRHGAGFCWLLGHWAAFAAVMRSICLCFLPAVTLTASVDCCYTPPPQPQPPLFHSTPPQPKVPDTQQLNKNTQISHVDHGKNFQLPGPGQLDLAKVTCAVAKSLHHKLCFSKGWTYASPTFPSVTSHLSSVQRLWWISTKLRQQWGFFFPQCFYSKHHW